MFLLRFLFATWQLMMAADHDAASVIIAGVIFAAAASAKVRIIVATRTTRRISLRDTTVNLAAGSIKIPLWIDDYSGVAAIQGRLSYNPVVLEAKNIEKGTAFGGFSLSDSLVNRRQSTHVCDPPRDR